MVKRLVSRFILGTMIIAFLCAGIKAQAKTTVEKVFKKSDEVVYNPLIGYAFPADTISAVADNNLVYVDLTWREWEPEKDVYDIERLKKDNYLDRWRTEGKHVVFRFILDRPTSVSERDIPDWLYKETNKDGKWYETSYGKGFSPNYANEYLIKRHEKALLELGKFFSDGFLSYVQLGSVGHWGEWHTNVSEKLPALPSEVILGQYVEHYNQAFPQAHKMMRYPMPWVKDNGFGVYNDMLGNQKQTDKMVQAIKSGGKYSHSVDTIYYKSVKNIWEQAPVGGEFTSDRSWSSLLNYNFTDTLSMVDTMHMTFIGPKAPVKKNLSHTLYDNIDIVRQRLGYSYWISKAAYKNGELTLHWQNDGLAPMYWDWPVYVYIYNQSGEKIVEYPIKLELSTLLNGQMQTTNTKINLKTTGVYQLGVAVVDPMTKKPAVQLEMQTEHKNKVAMLLTINH